MNRELLEQPFSPEQIKQREGSHGKVLKYVEANSVIQRLNDAFNGAWSFEIIDQKLLKQTDEVLVLGKLIVGDIVKSQFGSTKITRSDQSGEPVSIADDFKASATDALKKCATLLGVGLHLYNGNNGKKPGNGRQSGNNNPSNGFNNNGYGGNGGGNGNGRLSGKQFRYIHRLSEDLAISKYDLDQDCMKKYGTDVQGLTKCHRQNKTTSIPPG